MKSFQFAPGLDLRVIDKDGEPWFVAKDVCDVLDIHTRDIRKVLDADEVSELSVDSVHLTRGGKGRPPRALINESGLYSLILKSRKPEAKAFKKWVTSEVLPAIRKNGGYMAPAVAKLAVESPAEYMARALVMANETIAGLQKAAKGLEAKSPASASRRTRSRAQSGRSRPRGCSLVTAKEPRNTTLHSRIHEHRACVASSSRAGSGSKPTSCPAVLDGMR